MLETVRNAFKLKEIRSRIIYTLLMLVVVRIGTQLPIPGVNGSYFSEWFSGNSGFICNWTGRTFRCWL